MTQILPLSKSYRFLLCERCHHATYTNIAGNILDPEKYPEYQCPIVSCGHIQKIADAIERAKHHGIEVKIVREKRQVPPSKIPWYLKPRDSKQVTRTIR